MRALGSLGAFVVLGLARLAAGSPLPNQYGSPDTCPAPTATTTATVFITKAAPPSVIVSTRTIYTVESANVTRTTNGVLTTTVTKLPIPPQTYTVTLDSLQPPAGGSQYHGPNEQSSPASLFPAVSASTCTVEVEPSSAADTGQTPYGPANGPTGNVGSSSPYLAPVSIYTVEVSPSPIAGAGQATPYGSGTGKPGLPSPYQSPTENGSSGGAGSFPPGYSQPAASYSTGSQAGASANSPGNLPHPYGGGFPTSNGYGGATPTRANVTAETPYGVVTTVTCTLYPSSNGGASAGSYSSPTGAVVVPFITITAFTIPWAPTTAGTAGLTIAPGSFPYGPHVTVITATLFQTVTIPGQTRYETVVIETYVTALTLTLPTPYAGVPPAATGTPGNGPFTTVIPYTTVYNTIPGSYGNLSPSVETPYGWTTITHFPALTSSSLLNSDSGNSPYNSASSLPNSGPENSPYGSPGSGIGSGVAPAGVGGGNAPLVITTTVYQAGPTPQGYGALTPTVLTITIPGSGLANSLGSSPSPGSGSGSSLAYGNAPGSRQGSAGSSNATLLATTTITQSPSAALGYESVVPNTLTLTPSLPSSVQSNPGSGDNPGSGSSPGIGYGSSPGSESPSGYAGLPGLGQGGPSSVNSPAVGNSPGSGSPSSGQGGPDAYGIPPSPPSAYSLPAGGPGSGNAGSTSNPSNGNGVPGMYSFPASSSPGIGSPTVITIWPPQGSTASTAEPAPSSQCSSSSVNVNPSLPWTSSHPLLSPGATTVNGTGAVTLLILSTSTFTNIIPEPTTTYTFLYDHLTTITSVVAGAAITPAPMMVKMVKRIIRRQSGTGEMQTLPLFANISSAVAPSTSLPGPIITTSSSAVGSASIPATVSASAAEPTCSLALPDMGTHILDFEGLPPGEITTTYQRLWFSEDFFVVPPPSGKYDPSSGRQFVQYIPTDLLTGSSIGSQNSCQIGVGDQMTNPDFAWNANSFFIGCNYTQAQASTEPSPDCGITVTGFRYNAALGYEQAAMSQVYWVAANCTEASGCPLQPVELTGFEGLTSIVLEAEVDEYATNFWMDDFIFTWANNSDPAAMARLSTPHRKDKRVEVESAGALSLLTQWICRLLHI